MEKHTSPAVQPSVQLYPSSDEENEVQTLNSLSHKAVMDKFKDGLAELIVGDPLLSDLPSQVTADEVNAQLALHYGQAMTINVIRYDDTIMPIVVEQKASVVDLRNAIKSFMTLKLSREGERRKISWRCIWRTYWLVFDGQRLVKDHKLLREYGITNNAEIKFVKKLREK